jgi:hypothetical protein
MKPHIVDFTPVSRFTLYPRLFTERMILTLLITNTVFILFNTIGDLIVYYFSSDNDCRDFFKHINTYPRFSFIKK